MKKVLIPIPSYGFDPTEMAIPWLFLRKNGFAVIFATPSGKKGEADKIMLNGHGLGLFSSLLIARKDTINAYSEMENSQDFLNPISYSDIYPDEFDGVFLPGGHHKGVKEYLESDTLHSLMVEFFAKGKKAAAVCHGPLLLAKSINPENGRSVIYEYKTTSLLKIQEYLAYYLTKAWAGDYYLTYPGLSVEDEVKASLKSKKQFVRGNLPLFRETPEKPKRGFFVKDRNYVSARWPGDIYSLSFAFISLLKD